MEMMKALENVSFDFEETLKRFAGNRAILEKFIKKFPGDPTMQKLADAIKENDYKKIIEYAHTIKGTSANLGMKNLSESSAALVSAVRGGSYENIDTIFGYVKKEYEELLKAIEQID